MGQGRRSPLSLNSLLAAVEAAPPVAAVDVLAGALAEAVGVLELGLDDFPVEQTVADVALAAHFLAYVVIANRRYTDLFEWGQRSVPLSLAAEIQHRLLPGAFTCEAGQFTLAAWLQPAGEIGGDTFDFSLERDTLHVSMTDAMGHTMDAALLATVLVGALRNARRRGVELAEQARLANAALSEQEHARARGGSAPDPGGAAGKRRPATRRRHGAVSRLAWRPSPRPRRHLGSRPRIAPSRRGGRAFAAAAVREYAGWLIQDDRFC